MSAIQQLITATAGGHALPSFTITSTIPSSPSENDSPIDIFYDWSKFQGQTVYWSIAYGTNCSLFNFTGDQTGTITLNGDGTGGYFYVYPKANNVTTGDWYFSINVGSTVYGTDYGTFGPYLVTDSSTTPSTSLVFDIDPANITDIYANGGAGFNVPDTGGLNINGLGYYATTSASAGGSLVLNGSGEYVVLPDLVNSNYPSVTVSAWIKPVSPTGALNQTILAKETCYKLRINGDGSLSWGVSNNGSSWTYTAVSSTGLLTGGQWYHIAATVDISHATVYLNGQQIAQTTGVYLAKNSQPFVIGAYANQYGVSDYFAGSMGEVKMWNFAATDSDVANEYNNTVSRYIKTSGSFSFSGVTDQYITVGGTTTDWAMGKTGTFEWWQKSNIANIGQSGDHQFGGLLIQGSVGGQNGIDIFQKPGINTHLGGNTAGWPEPSTSTWVHMAVTLEDTGGAGAATHVYYNGVEQTHISGYVDALLSNSTDALHIGTRVPGANYQNWVGLITNIHISTATLYTGNFTPTIRTTLTTGTVFLMNSAYPLVDLSYYELDNVLINENDGINFYISTSTYPNLNNLIHQGDSIIDPGNPSHTGTVTGPIVLSGDTTRWVIPIPLNYNPGVFANFRGPRHTISGGIYELSDDVPVVPPLSLTAPPSDGRYLPWRDTNSNLTANIVNVAGNWGTTSTYGGGLVWDAGNQGYIELNYVNTSSVFTLSFAADFESTGTNWNSIFGTQGGGTNDIYAFIYGGQELMEVGTANDYTITVTGNISGLAWWDFVYNDTGVTIYRNASLAATGTLINPNTGWSSPLRIGLARNTGSDFLAGTIYQIKYQQTALDQTGITSQYNVVKSTYGLS